jgi:ribokinase
MVTVARLAGVSVGTVFNVVNDAAAVRPATRKKVEAAIRTLSFRPNALPLSPIAATRPASVRTPRDDLPQLIVVGAASVDYTAMLSVLPHRNDRSTARSIEKSLGGPAANTAVFAAALADEFPVTVELVTTLGDDGDSDWVLEELRQKNVDTASVRRQVNQRISRCIVLVERNGSRTILNEPVTLLESDLAPYADRTTKQRRCLHLDGSQVDHLLKTVLDIGRTGTTLSLQMTDLPAELHTTKHLAKLIRHFDLVFFNRDVVQDATRCRGGLAPVVEAALALVRSIAPKGIMILTLGEDGALIIFPDRREPIHVPGLAAHVVDTTGAGDAFAGAFLSVWLNTRDAITAARYANAAGAFAVSVEGTQNSVPTAVLLQRLIEVAVRTPEELDGVVRYSPANDQAVT